MGQAAKEAGRTLGEDWLATQLHELKHEGPTAVLAQLRTLVAAHPDVEVLRENLAYLQKREAQMQYPTFQAAGWPIGSGSVESANKVVVEARLKGSGMHWQRHNVNPMLVLRNAVGNERWPEIWTGSWTQRQQRRSLRREQRSQQRLMGACWMLAALLVRTHPVVRSPASASTTTTAAAPRQAPASRSGSGYSWRKPFLRRPPSSSAVPGGLRAKK